MTDKTIPMPHGPWIERWHGSDPDRGSSIRTLGGEVIASLGADKALHQAAREIVYQHNVEVAAVKWPDAMPDSLAEILGMPNFQCGPIAHFYRDFDGAEIPPKAEAEQAFIIHKLVGFWFAHGDNWREAAAADLDRLQAKAKEGAA